MRLIAETEEENLMLPGLSALMADLGVISTEYRTDEAYAVTFLSAGELSYLYADDYDLTREEAAYLLEELEPYLRTAMAAAAARMIDRAIHKNMSRIKKLASSPELP